LSNYLPAHNSPVKESVQLLRFDPRIAAPFCEKSLSEETRRAYRRVIKEFFLFVRGLHPSRVTPTHVLSWRDALKGERKKSATISFKLTVVRSFFEYLRADGYVHLNPASTRLVTPPAVSDEMKGRALTAQEVRYLLTGPDRAKPEGARDYALLLVMLRLGLRVSEACSLRASSVHWSHGRWTIRLKVKGGRERTLPLPPEVRLAIDEYLKLDRKRRGVLHSDGEDAYLFQPAVNYRTLEFAKPLSTRMAWNIVQKWAEYGRLGKLSPHDLRRTAITRALDQGLSYRQVQMMSGHRDPKTVMRYDHGRENLEQNAVNFLDYAEE
jgi:integrase/recombinase XerD